MTTYDESLLAAQFAALAPEPLEGRWDDVLREAVGSRDDRRRLARSAVSQGRRRYLVALVAAVLLVVVVGAASAIGGVRAFILDQWWVATMPGFAIVIVSLGFCFLGDGLRDVLDPKHGERK